MIFKKRYTPIAAVGRLRNPFKYKAEYFECGSGSALLRLDEYLNETAREGWKLHTIDRQSETSYFCVWEQLDFKEGVKT